MPRMTWICLSMCFHIYVFSIKKNGFCRSQVGRVREGEPFNCGFIWLHRRKAFLSSQNIWLNIWTLEHLNIWTFDRTSPQRFPLFSEHCNRSLPSGPAAQIRRKLEKFRLFMWISAYLCTQESYKIEPNAEGEQREPSIFGRHPPALSAM